MKPERLRQLRRKMQIIFQDPYSSLNPAEDHGAHHRRAPDRSTTSAIRKGEPGPGGSSSWKWWACGPSICNRYPHEFSGGQRQRIGDRPGPGPEPELIIARRAGFRPGCLHPGPGPEPALEDLQKEFDLTYLFIAHDLSVVEHISDRVAVMYLGRIVEMARLTKFTGAPAILTPRPALRRTHARPQGAQKKDHPDGGRALPIDPPAGCVFHPRCPYRREECESVAPEFREIEPSHFLGCHLPHQFRTAVNGSPAIGGKDGPIPGVLL